MANNLPVRHSGDTRLSFIQRAGVALKVLFPGIGGQQWGGWTNFFRVLLPGTNIDYEKLVGDPWSNSAVYNCTRWIGTNITHPRFAVRRHRGKGKNAEVEDHPLTRMMRRPNGEYSGNVLLRATSLSYNVCGNAYWYKERDNGGRVIKLWYVPHYSMWPQWPADGSEWISHWIYNPWGSGKYIKVVPKDIVHFRMGMDPRNTRLGLSPLSAVMREIFGDNEASSVEAALLHNNAIPGLLISPEGEGVINEEGAKALLSRFESDYTGDNAGRPLVSPLGVKATRLALTPKELTMREMRMGKEERISGALGLPPFVAGLGAGIDKASSGLSGGAVVDAYYKMGYEGNILPTLDDWGDTIDDELLGDFGDPAREEVYWDTSEIPCLQKDANETATRWSGLYTSGVAKRLEAREAVGLDADPVKDDVYVASVIVVSAEKQPTDPVVEETPDAADDGANDSGDDD